MSRLFLFLSVCIMALSANGQGGADTLPKPENIKLVARYRDGSVELRWYPIDVASWRKANATGYTLKRMEMSDAGSSAGYKELAVLKPYTAEEWRQKANANDPMVKTVMQANVVKAPKAGQTILDAQNDENAMFFAYSLATSFSADAAKGAGLMYKDPNVEPGKQYIYSLSINPGKSKKNVNDETLSVIDTRNPYKALSPVDFTLEEGEGFVKLKWNNTSNQDNFIAYDIERSADGGRSFAKVNKTPFISVSEQDAEEFDYTDSVKNYIPYQYRIVGLTPWVDKGAPSEILKGMGRDKTGASPPMNTRARGDRSRILVTWELPVQSRDLKGFLIARSNKLEGPFAPISDREKLVDKSLRMFTDPKPTPGEPYYAVYSVDTANNLSSTFSVMASVYDTVGPSKPTAVRGRIDSTGVVKLDWKFGNDNDLVGYQVYVANGKDNVFRQITGSPLVDSVFMDTVSMRSLTREVYYKITAVDYNNNASDYSELITLQRPDVVPPAAPMISGYEVKEGMVKLSLVGSSSDDVTKYQLMRADAGGARQVMGEWKTVQASFEDRGAKEGASYAYTLVATDASGLSSASSALNISVLENEIKPGITSLVARFDEREKKVMLQWQFDQAGTGYSFLVFSRNSAGDWAAVKNVPSSSKQFTHTPASTGKIEYAVKVMYNSGAESELSQPATAEVK